MSSAAPLVSFPFFPFRPCEEGHCPDEATHIDLPPGLLRFARDDERWGGNSRDKGVSLVAFRRILAITLLFTPCVGKAQGFDTLLQKLTGSKVEKEISGSSADQVASETADPVKPLPSVPIPSSVEILSSQQEAADFTPPENIKTNGVVVQGLDKITGRVFITTAPLNQEIGFGPLRIIVHHCEKAPAESRDQSSAFVTILEAKEAFAPQEVFSGWMFSSSPALSSFDHPLYDVWVKECKILTKSR